MAASPPPRWQLWDWPFFEPHHHDLAEEVAGWCEGHIAAMDHAEDAMARARRLLGMIGDAGFLSYMVPEPGQGIDARAVCILRECITYYDALADEMLTMQGIGTAAIHKLGSDAQRDRYLAPARRGETVAALALTEAQCGSDVANMATTATRDGDDYVLDGEKVFISNAGLADHYVVVARTGEAPAAKGLSVFLVDAGTPGLLVGEQRRLIADHPLADVTFRACRVPASTMIGAPGAGFFAAMGTFNVFRPSVGAAAVGAARRALAETLGRVATREMFGGRMGQLPGVQSAVADMACDIETSALAVYRAAWGQDTGRGNISYESSLAKLVATEAPGRVVDRAVQLFGGLGVTYGSVVERLYREVRPMRIYEGASEVQKLVIGRDLLKRAGAV